MFTSKMCARRVSIMSRTCLYCNKVEMPSSEVPIRLFCEMAFDPHKTKRRYWLSDMRWHNKCSYAWANIHPSVQYLHCLSFSGSQGNSSPSHHAFCERQGAPGGQVSSLSQRKHIHTHRHRGRKRLENMLTPNRTLPHGQGHVAVRRQRHNSRCVCILASVHFILTCLYICSVFKVNRSEPFKKLNHLLGPSFRRSSLQTAPQGFLLFRYKMSCNNHSVAILTIQSHDTFLFTCPVTHIHDWVDRSVTLVPWKCQG